MVIEQKYKHTHLFSLNLFRASSKMSLLSFDVFEGSKAVQCLPTFIILRYSDRIFFLFMHVVYAASNCVFKLIFLRYICGTKNSSTALKNENLVLSSVLKF